MKLARVDLQDGVKCHIQSDAIDAIILPKKTVGPFIAFIQIGVTNIQCTPTEAKLIVEECKLDASVELVDGYVHFHSKKVSYIKIPSILSKDNGATIVIGAVTIKLPIDEATKVLALLDKDQLLFMVK